MKIDGDYIYTEDGKLIAVITDDATLEERDAIIKGTEAYDSISEFVDQINSGSFKLRAATRKFEEIIKS